MIRKISISCILSWWLLLAICPAVKAQPVPAADPLTRTLAAARTDTEKVSLLVAMLEQADCADTALKFRYAASALQLASKADWPKGTYLAYCALGKTYDNCCNNYQISINYFNLAAATAAAAGDKTNESVAYNIIGYLYSHLNLHEKAIEYYRRVLQLQANQDEEITALANLSKIYVTIGDYPVALTYYDSALKTEEHIIRSGSNSSIGDSVRLAALLLEIGDVFRTMKQYPNALANYQAGLSLGKKTGNTFLITHAFMCIARSYKYQDDFSNAIAYFNLALEHCKDARNKNVETDLLDQLANVYLEMNDVPTAMRYAQDALSLAQGQHTELLFAIFTTLGRINNKLGHYKEATSYLEKAVAFCKENGEQAYQRDALEALSIAYEKTGKPQLALDAHRQFIAIRDSLFNIDKANEIARIDLQSKYDRQRQSANAENELRMQQQRTWTYGGFAGLGLVVVLSFFIYRNYANQKKANVLITVEKENAEMQRQRAERSEQFKQQFLANMSHEIRTPMNAVSGMTDLLIEKKPRPDQLNYLQVISKSSDILLHIINDILDLSKIEAGKLEMEQIDFSLADTVNLVKQTLSVKAEEKGLHLITEIDDTATDVLVGDPYRINQVLINLGGNAIKFTERGTVEIAIKKTAEDNDTISLEFAVHDTGAGIPEDKLNDLFESFKQVNRSDTRKYGGTGLGLSISKQLVELQGGTIAVSSKVGLGTTFSFTIQFPKGSAERLADRTRGEQQADGSVLYGLRILLADDNEYNRLVASEALNLKAKVVIHEAHNGEEAVQMLAKEDYDVVLMDVQMPVMNGLDATRAIRSQLPAPKNQTPVIALTASMLRNDLDKCIQAGMNTYVPKPFKTSQLIAAIAQVTGRIGYIAPPEATMAAKETAVPTLSMHSDGGVTDLAALIKFCEGEEDRVKKYISIYLRAVPGFEEKAKAAIAARNMEKIATLAHTFKPKWMMMGMEASATLARKIEALSFDNGDIDTACQYLNTLIEHNTLSVPELERNV